MMALPFSPQRLVRVLRREVPQAKEEKNLFPKELYKDIVSADPLLCPTEKIYSVQNLTCF
jgi:hypothetical protein